MSLGMIFGAGILTYLTPCVLPLIPIYLSALVGGDIRSMEGGSRGTLILRAMLFSVGFIAVFTLLGLTASTFGSAMAEHKLVLQIGGALLILVFGLKFLGVIRIPFFDRVVQGDDSRFKTRFAWLNALIMGFVFALGWSPCVGPVLGSILTYTASTASSPLAGAGYLTIYGLGFALPLIITAAFAEAGAKGLKKLYPHLPKFEKAVGILLILVAGSLFWDMAPLLQEPKSHIHETTAATAAANSNDPKEEVLPQMLELYSANCTICKKMQPLIADITAECNGNSVDIHLLDISKAENRYLKQKYRLVGVPTFLFLDKEGEEVARLVGHQTESALFQALATIRGEQCPGVGPLPDDAEPPAPSGDQPACDLEEDGELDGGSCEG